MGKKGTASAFPFFLLFRRAFNETDDCLKLWGSTLYLFVQDSLCLYAWVGFVFQRRQKNKFNPSQRTDNVILPVTASSLLAKP